LPPIGKNHGDPFLGLFLKTHLIANSYGDDGDLDWMSRSLY